MNRSVLNILRADKKKRINSYYLGVIYNGQSAFLRAWNYLFYRMLVLVSSILFFLYFSEGQKLFSAFFAGVSVLLIYHFIAKYFYNKQFTQVKREVNLKLAEEEFWRRIKAMDKESFVQFVAEILNRLPFFSEIEITEHLENEGIDILCKYGDQLTAIQCQLLDGDNAVESRDARQLSKAMSRRKYSRGFIISTTDFRDDTKRFCNLIKEKRQIKLLGQKELIQMAIDAGKYPKEEEINDLILKKIERQNRVFQEAREKLFNKPRLKPYFLYGTFLLVLGLFLFDKGPKFLYLLGASGLYLLGITGFFLNLKNFKGRENGPWFDKLF
ncbi:MAG: restriction endonuclease [Clostridia bacterium]|nr:restriction endonuclease [Clostridia bacterium]